MTLVCKACCGVEREGKMNNLTIKIIGSIAITFGILCWVKSARQYLIINHEKILWTFIITALATLLGVFIAFRMENCRLAEKEKDIFKRNFAAIISECADNQAVVNSLKEQISAQGTSLKLLSNEVANRLVSDPLLYKYTGDEYMYALRKYIGSIKLVNRMLQFVFDDFITDGTIKEKNLKDLNELFNNCLYYTYILQYQSQLYVHSYDVRWSLKPYNYDEVMGWIKKTTSISISDLKSKVDEMSKLEEGKRKELQEGIKKVLNQ